MFRVRIFCLLMVSATAIPQNLSLSTQSLATELLRRAVDGELKAHATDHSHWKYKLQAVESGKEEIKLVVETRDGDLDRLESVNGHPITAEQKKQEDLRIQGLLQRADERDRKQRAQAEDARKMETVFKSFPDAVLASYGQRQGDLVEIFFKPNPGFHPSCNEALVFHEMEGRMWIDEKKNRITEIDGHLIEDVKFLGGLLGHLSKGGEFHVRQMEVAPGHWDITLLHVNMHGKAVIFQNHICAARENAHQL